MDLEDLEHSLQLQELGVAAQALRLVFFTENLLYCWVVLQQFFMRKKQPCWFLWDRGSVVIV